MPCSTAVSLEGPPCHEWAPAPPARPGSMPVASAFLRCGSDALSLSSLGQGTSPVSPLTTLGHEIDVPPLLAQCAHHRRSHWGFAPHSDQLASGTG